MTQPPPSHSPEPQHRFRYTATLADEIERRWQQAWDGAKAYVAPNPGEAGFDGAAPKFYCLDMFPYPSGAGLHVGHPEGYTATDIVCRYKKMKGFRVLHPMGWDAFGLPAEQYAIQTGVHPAITTRKAIDNFRRQLQRFGFSYDWSREFGTIDEEYYRWTQWIFLKLYDAWFDEKAVPAGEHALVQGTHGRARPIGELVTKLERGELPLQVNSKADEAAPLERVPRSWADCTAEEKRRIIDSYRLAYLSTTTVNWCPKLGTVLANDEVIDGRSERGGFPVLRKPLKQWMFRITAYADRLLRQIEGLEWPESTRTMQREWIGRSEGAEVEFEVLGTPSLREGRTETNEDTRALGAAKSGGLSREEIANLFKNPALAMRPRDFVGRDPFPEGVRGAVGDLVRTERNLPHLRLAGATYFVTWRCQEGVALVPAEREAVLESLRHFDGEECRVFAACVMPDHVHWLMRPLEDSELSNLCERVKRFSARKINEGRGSAGRIWDPECFDHIVRDGQYFAEFTKYMLENPVAAGLSSAAHEYPFLFIHEATVGRGGGDDGSGPLSERGGTQSNIPLSERGGTRDRLKVFTTRPDTLFGATYMVVAPEHPLCAKALQDDGISHTIRDVLNEYVHSARHRSDTERQENKVKTGVFTGYMAMNPATGEAIPVWASDYVLMGYGTGAIMAVPAHDQRDFEFAKAFKLPIKDVVYPRAVLAMRYFTEHAYPDGNIDGNWREELADFLGLVTSSTRELEPLDVVLTVVRERRLQPEVEVDPPEVGARRGGTRAVWLELIDDLKITGFGDLRDRFERREYYASFGQAFGEPGIAANSANSVLSLNGHTTPHARERMMDWLESIGAGSRRVNFRLRDWTFSRQRYWGEPFPIVYDQSGHPYPVREDALPVKLPALADYAPVDSEEPKPLLAKATQWVNTTAGEAGVDPLLLDPSTPVKRETNTMPGSAGSSWYAIRYCDAKNNERIVGEEAEKAWMGPGTDGGGWGVDLYLGGSEHAVGHLLYSRFWQNVLYDLGFVTTPEPFRKLFHQGLITSFSFQRPDKTLVAADQVEEPSEGVFVERGTGTALKQIVAKMSKSLKNVVNPDDVIGEFGADTFRLYEMYMGPLEASKPWNPRDITGLFRFLQRLWRLVTDEQTGALRESAAPDAAIEKQLHRTIAKVGTDIEAMSFNTAIAAMIELVNLASGLDKPGADKSAGVLTRDQLARVSLVLSPFAPHLAEEIWTKAGKRGFAALQAWPAHDPALLVDSEIEVPVSVMGKMRSKVMVPAGASAKVLEAAALADAKIQELIAGKTVKKIIVVPGKMVNLVLG
ncbi:MAG: class I tRNA ligase family protein [Phycisphaerales bacterium]|jgi:leucyl-tRNA synthetase